MFGKATFRAILVDRERCSPEADEEVSSLGCVRIGRKGPGGRTQHKSLFEFETVRVIFMVCPRSVVFDRRPTRVHKTQHHANLLVSCVTDHHRATTSTSFKPPQVTPTTMLLLLSLSSPDMLGQEKGVVSWSMPSDSLRLVRFLCDS